MSKGRIRKCAHRFLRVVLLAIVALFVVIVVGVRMGQLRALTLLSASMQPSLPVGSVVVERPESAAAVRIGQVITFERPDTLLVTHRVYSIQAKDSELLVSTKGDNNPTPDTWIVHISRSQTVWHVAIGTPFVGYVLQPLHHLGGPGLLLILPSILFAAACLISIWAPREQHEDLNAAA